MSVTAAELQVFIVSKMFTRPFGVFARAHTGCQRKNLQIIL